MSMLRGYWRTLQQYWQYPKGHFDIIDYGKAALWIIVTMVAVISVLTAVGGK